MHVFTLSAIIIATLFLCTYNLAQAESFSGRGNECSSVEPCIKTCCHKAGWCTTTAESCIKAKDCVSGCRQWPSTNTCTTQTLDSTNWPLEITHSATQVKDILQQSLQKCPGSVIPTTCHIFDMLGGATECIYCAFYYPYLMEAIAVYDLICPLRLAAFFAQIRHETAALNYLWQSADNGAGGIHMIPNNFAFAINDIPRLNHTYSVEFGDQSLVTVNTDINFQFKLARFMMRSEHAFLTAAWWFEKGASEILGYQGCTDLRQDADVGLGTRDPPTGYYKISKCIFGSLVDEGLTQRLHYYQTAIQIIEQPPSQENTDTTTSTSAQMANLLLGTIVIVLLCISVYFYYRHRNKPATYASKKLNKKDFKEALETSSTTPLTKDIVLRDVNEKTKPSKKGKSIPLTEKSTTTIKSTAPLVELSEESKSATILQKGNDQG